MRIGVIGPQTKKNIYRPINNRIPAIHPDPIGADYEQAFAGANFNTEVVSGALVEVSGCHFKALATLKVSGDPLEAPLKSPDLYLPAADNFCERSGHNLMK